jgi:fatty acid desaturase
MPESTLLERPAPDFTGADLPAGFIPGELSVQERNASDYKELSLEVKSLGLLERQPLWYAARMLILAGFYVLGFAALFILGSSPWVLLVAAGFGVLFTQTAFLAHDGAHKQIFTSGKHNEWFSRVIGNLLVGLSYGWWMNKHSRHHANPNKIGKDNDIRPGVIIFTAHDAINSPRRGVKAWFMARQHWLFFPILTLAGLDLHVNAIKAVSGSKLHNLGEMKARGWEGIFLAIRLIGFPVLVFLAAGPWMGLAFMAIQIAFFGLTMGGSFAPNHKGMPILPPTMEIDFMRRQTLMSRNITGGWLIDVGMGGLNYQIEHHLFPSMPSINLRKVKPIVEAYCKERNIRYTQTSLIGSYRIVFKYLQRVGLKHVDPFECPVTAQFRSR